MPRAAVLAVRIVLLLLLAGLILFGAGCASDPSLPPPAKPVLVETVKLVFVPIDPALTRQVRDPAPSPGKTGQSLLDGYDARGDALMQCNGQLEGVASVQGTPKKPC